MNSRSVNTTAQLLELEVVPIRALNSYLVRKQPHETLAEVQTLEDIPENWVVERRPKSAYIRESAKNQTRSDGEISRGRWSRRRKRRNWKRTQLRQVAEKKVRPLQGCAVSSFSSPAQRCALPLTEIAGEAGPTKNSLDFAQDFKDYCFPASSLLRAHVARTVGSGLKSWTPRHFSDFVK